MLAPLNPWRRYANYLHTVFHVVIALVGAQLREAFQSKKQQNLGIIPNRGGGVEKSKKSQVSVGNSSKLGGGGLQK